MVLIDLSWSGPCIIIDTVLSSCSNLFNIPFCSDIEKLVKLEHNIEFTTSNASILAYLNADEHEIEVEYFDKEAQQYKTYVPENFFGHDFHIVKYEVSF